MKRSAELRDLSDDHHTVLVLALRAKRAARGDAGSSVRGAWAALEDGYRHEMRPHFEVEEAVLLPALERAGEGERAERTRREHAEIRGLLDAPERGAEALGALAGLLERHVRFEERELFEVAEEVLSARDLRAVADARRGAR